MNNNYFRPGSLNGLDGPAAGDFYQNDDWSEIENGTLTLGWLFWTMQLIVEIWGALFGVIYLLSLFGANDRLMHWPGAFIYLLIGGLLTWKNERRALVIKPNPGLGYRVLYTLAWPIRQTLLDMQRMVLAEWESAPGKQPDKGSIQFSLFFIFWKWVFIWMITFLISIAIGSVLEQVLP